MKHLFYILTSLVYLIAIESARKSLNDVESEVRQLDVNLENINKQLDFDYGKDKEWLKLKDVCVEKNEGE